MVVRKTYFSFTEQSNIMEETYLKPGFYKAYLKSGAPTVIEVTDDGLIYAPGVTTGFDKEDLSYIFPTPIEIERAPGYYHVKLTGGLPMIALFVTNAYDGTTTGRWYITGESKAFNDGHFEYIKERIKL